MDKLAYILNPCFSTYTSYNFAEEHENFNNLNQHQNPLPANELQKVFFLRISSGCVSVRVDIFSSVFADFFLLALAPLQFIAQSLKRRRNSIHANIAVRKSFSFFNLQTDAHAIHLHIYNETFKVPTRE